MTAARANSNKSSLRIQSAWEKLGEFLITGGATLVLIPLAYSLRFPLEDNGAPNDYHEYVVSMVAFYAAYVINDPHFGVSYLLFYKNTRQRCDGTEFQGAQRIRYIVAGYLVPLLLVAWITWALLLQDAELLGQMVQAMFFLVGWHYVKQGFGVLMVLSARRDIRFDTKERWVLLSHCFCAWAYAWSTPREMGGTYQENGLIYTAFKQPPHLALVSGSLLIASCFGVAYISLRRWRARQPFPPWAATCGYFVSLWLWTIYSTFDPLLSYVVPGLHSLQYWYFVYLMKKNESLHDQKESKVPTNFLGRAAFSFGPLYGRLSLFFLTAVAISWLGFNGLPGFLDETTAATVAMLGPNPELSIIGLGATPYVAAFAVFINIHHYFMDHVLWRRENSDTKYLRNSESVN